jgi:hypothetical protein
MTQRQNNTRSSGNNKPATRSRHSTTRPTDIISWGQYYLVDHSPIQLPALVRHAIVQYGPWVLVVVGLFWLQAILLLFRIGLFGMTALSQFGPGLTSTFAFETIFVVIELALLVMALPGLFKRQIVGWNSALVLVLVSLVYNVYRASLINGLLTAVLGFYVLFQIRSHYKS